LNVDLSLDRLLSLLDRDTMIEDRMNDVLIRICVTTMNEIEAIIHAMATSVGIIVQISGTIVMNEIDRLLEMTDWNHRRAKLRHLNQM